MAHYAATDNFLEDLRRRFCYHAPKGDQAERYVKIRETALAFAELLASVTPASREQSLALTKLDELVMHANAAIARNEAHNETP